MNQTMDFPEVSEFLEHMQLRKGLFGYEKEDVLSKMQQLNRLYQDRLLVMKGQMEQESRNVREEAEKERQAAREEAEQIRREAREQLEQQREQIRLEERQAILAELEEQRETHRKELALLSDELARAAEQLQGLRGHIGQMTEKL